MWLRSYSAIDAALQSDHAVERLHAAAWVLAERFLAADDGFGGVVEVSLALCGIVGDSWRREDAELDCANKDEGTKVVPHGYLH